MSISGSRRPKDSLVFLLELERYLFNLTGQESVRYGEGVHTKHRHTRYHDFFIQRVAPGARVLDIGCGKGELAHDLAQAGAKVLGVERDKTMYETAVNRFSHENIEFIHGDALTNIPGGTVDTVVLSNILEHIENRVAFLKSVQSHHHPKKWLIRVPMYDRDWRVPLMEEVGVDYRLDGAHYIEYTMESFEREMNEAGLDITDAVIRWGEIWCEAAPAGGAAG